MLIKEKKDGIWWVSHPDRYGRTQKYPTGISNDTEFETWVKDSKLAELAKLADAGGITSETVSRILGSDKRLFELFSEWKDWLSTVVEETTVKLYTESVMAWALRANIFSNYPNAITEKDIYDFVNSNNDLKVASRKAYLAAVRSLFKWLHSKGHILADPSKLVRVNKRRLTQAQKEPKKAIPFTEADISRINTHIDREISNQTEMLKRGEHDKSRSTKRHESILAKRDNYYFWKVAVNLSWHTALRFSDVVSLEWESIKGDTIIVWTEKRDTRVELPIQKGLRQILNLIPFRDLVECFPEQKQWESAKCSTYFKRLCIAAGVPSLSFHGLRHGAIQRWEQEGFSLKDLAKRAGHSSTVTTEGYL